MGSKIPFLQRDPPLRKICVTYALSRPQARRLHIERAGNKHTHRKVSLQRRMQAVAALQNRQWRGSKRLRRQESSRRTAVCILERRFAAQKRLQNLVSQPNEIYICAGLLLPVRAARSKR